MVGSQTPDSNGLAQLGELSVVAAHEIRNRLGRVMLLAETLESKLPRGTEGHELIGLLASSVGHLEGLVEDLLVYGRTERPEKKLTSLGELLRDVSAQAAEHSAFRGVAIERDGPDVAVRCSPRGLRLAFFNILLNAAEALAGAGRITIAIARRPAREGCTVVLRDSGPGMPPEVLQRAFDLFFTTKTGGTGVGLALARRVIQLHDWDVSLRCPSRGGTEVVVSIPEADVDSVGESARAREGNILVVEDDVASCQLLAEFLTDEGFRVREAASSEEALATSREFTPDVLLIDWRLENGASGCSVARELLKRYPSMAVVFQSGFESRDLHASLRSEPFPVYRILTKPISLRALPGILLEARRTRTDLGAVRREGSRTTHKKKGDHRCRYPM